jgi:hypothetical protein
MRGADGAAEARRTADVVVPEKEEIALFSRDPQAGCLKRSVKQSYGYQVV